MIKEIRFQYEPWKFKTKSLKWTQLGSFHHWRVHLPAEKFKIKYFIFHLRVQKANHSFDRFRTKHDLRPQIATAPP